MPCDIVEPVFIVVGADHLPVESGVLESHASVQAAGDVLCDSARARKLGHANDVRRIADQFAHAFAAAVDEVEINGRQAAVDQHAQKLLEDDADFRVDLDERSVTHEQCAHDLKRRDLQREIERCNDNDGAERPAVTA